MSNVWIYNKAQSGIEVAPSGTQKIVPRQKYINVKCVDMSQSVNSTSNRILWCTETSRPVELYECKLCEFKTKYKVSLRHHVLVHKDSSEVEMFQCAVCAYKTKYKNYLKVHLLIHKDRSEVRMYECEICHYQTKQKRILNVHRRKMHGINQIDSGLWKF
ncbi:hypothetical protein NQ317_007902 [Molorchus minor]|uniref:C2H2-type domain-containing protein n=1 Tax=Molorchus minor TaxID=1323400 RepID=A0ABQ9JUQ8_9CUCU|nr:hypothetical protein NQ317_007902 [Molorchus minor]